MKQILENNNRIRSESVRNNLSPKTVEKIGECLNITLPCEILSRDFRSMGNVVKLCYGREVKEKGKVGKMKS